MHNKHSENSQPGPDSSDLWKFLSQGRCPLAIVQSAITDENACNGGTVHAFARSFCSRPGPASKISSLSDIKLEIHGMVYPDLSQNGYGHGTSESYIVKCVAACTRDRSLDKLPDTFETTAICA